MILSSQELLKKCWRKVKPAIEAFLSERGLTLSQEKTKITHINDGFDFLGMNVRKYNGKLIIKPAKNSIKSFLADIRETIKSNATGKTEHLIYLLNPKIRGWSNYYRHVCSKEIFCYVDAHIFKTIQHRIRRRHPHKPAYWRNNKYFHTDKHRHWAREVMVEGEASFLTAEQNAHYWDAYPKSAQIRFCSYAPTSGEPIDDKQLLEHKRRSLEQSSQDTVLPCAPDYCGIAIKPKRFVFYSYRLDELSDVWEYLIDNNIIIQRRLSP